MPSEILCTFSAEVKNLWNYTSTPKYIVTCFDEYQNDGMVIPKELGKGCFCGNVSHSDRTKLVGNKHSRGNEPTTAHQQVTISDCFMVHMRYFKPDPGAV
jgi:hypothetical protein